MSSPFENPDARYLVVVNHEFQHALWPAFADLRPARLVEAMSQE